MEIRKMLLTPSKYTRQQTSIKVTKIAIHYVGNPMSTALGNRNYFEGLSKSHKTKASSHYIIGLQGEIIQCIPENEQSIATNGANPYSISIECCHPDTTGKFTDDTYKSLLELCADICKRYGLNPLIDIIRHYDISKKICPKWFVEHPNEFIKFKNMVNELINSNNVHTNTNVINSSKEVTFEQALKIVCDKINTNYEFWHKKNIKFFDKFIIKISQCELHELDKNRINLIIILDDALKIICDKAKLDYEYWKGQLFCDSSFPALIIKIAKSMK